MGVAYDLRQDTVYKGVLRINRIDLLCTDKTQHISGALDMFDEFLLIAKWLEDKLDSRMTALGHNLINLKRQLGLYPRS